MRLVDILLSLPLILIALLVVAIMGFKLINIILVMGGIGWIWHARIVRGNVLRIREEQYILAAVMVGTARVKMVFRHVLPNVLAPILVTATMQLGWMIIVESGLSFFGISGTTLSWGWDIAFGRKYLGTAWWIASFPGLTIFLTVLSLNVLGDFFRDVIDPYSKQMPMG
jgi:peptide/nickel transport system permease protein